MLIRHHIDELVEAKLPLHLAIGVFDGLHLGHQAVIARAVAAASKHGGLAGILTFDPHPIRVIAPLKAPSSLLETLGHKAAVCASLGCEIMIPLHFDAEMAIMTAEAFIERLCTTPVKTIAVGEDWRFGHRRAGDVAMLEKMSSSHGYELMAVPPVMFGGDRISSTRIRQAIHDGNLDEAAQMLGRRYSVTGTVIRGSQLGRQLGFPTANLETGHLQLPPNGVWAATAIDPDGRSCEAVANLGMRPTVDGANRTLEAHLLDFEGDLYGKNLELRFEKFLRSERKFESTAALQSQIARDIKAARNGVF
ncbi:MAG: bifunctional riboflavin kinase/FAD synthetase [Luteolibacter sp.]